MLTRASEHNDHEFGEYIENIAKSEDWRLIVLKLCDRLHNLRSAAGISDEKKRRYITQTETYFYGLISELRLLAGKGSIMKEAEKSPDYLEAEIQKEVANLKAALSETHGEKEVKNVPTDVS
jgi:(p)ppGpp synthase/HD superfamily hydrolase